MAHIFKTSLVLPLVFSLTACLEVDNKSNDKVADALTEQNKILQQQNQQQAEQIAQTKTSVSLTGVVNNLTTNANALNATVKVRIGLTSYDAVTVTNGAFQIDNLPADSDYEMLVHSTTGVFMDRVVYGRTRATSSIGKVVQDVGVVSVAAGVERKFKILNSSTSLPVTNLVLKVNSNVGSGASAEKYFHISNYDSSTQEYKITYPEHLNLPVTANLDIDGDGQLEYQSENYIFSSGGSLYISSGVNANTIYLIDLNVHDKVKVKVSIVDTALNQLAGAKLSINDTLNGVLEGTYDSVNSQYVVDAVMDNSLTIMVPSFKVGAVTYSSSSITISKYPYSGGVYQYSVSGVLGYNNQFTFPKSGEKVFNLVLQPSVPVISSNLSTVVVSPVVDPVTQGFKVFYSGPISLKSDSVQLIKKGDVQVVRGDDSSTDLVLPGTTIITSSDVQVPVDAKLSLNNTLLTVTPKEPLEGGFQYRYAIGKIIDSAVGVEVDPYNDQIEFSVKNTGAFAITDIKLDNNNYYTNSSLIKPKNSAGVNADVYAYSGSAVLYLPTSIENLKSLVINKVLVNQNGITSNRSQNYMVVNNGQVNYYDSVFSISAAYNENIVTNYNYYLNYVKGTALLDGKRWYAVNVGEYMQDDEASNANKISFEYAYETKDGVKESGTFELSVQ